MKQLSLLFAALALLVYPALNAQEIELPLTVVKEKARQSEREQKFQPRDEKSAVSLTLPFVDDFSNVTQPTNDPTVPESNQRWLDNSVYVNNHFPLDQPSVGVATFDGTNNIGFPYNLGVSTSYGSADTLTSCPIDISALDENDQVHMVFSLQSAGLGNVPELQDSIYIEFRLPGSDLWQAQWSLTSDVQTGFQRFFVPINNPTYFTDAFQFRFRNSATLSGAVDIWNLDYLIIDAGIDPANFTLSDVAFTQQITTFVDGFTAIPWTHYIDNPVDHMLVEQAGELTNLGDNPNNVSIRYEVSNNGSNIFTSPTAINGNVPGNSTTSIPVGVGSAGFSFPDLAEDGCASFDIDYILTVGANDISSNDSLSFTQEFSNYYAYDDGTAESAWGLTNSPGAQIALRYKLDQADTLLGILVNFVPFVDDAEGETFILRAWEDDNGQPGDVLIDNFGFQEVTVFEGARNSFSYYTYDSPIPVSGTIHVGWVQQEGATIPIGLDKNTNSNETKFRFKTSSVSGTPWEISQVPGSVMIRPVLAAGKGSDFVSVEEEELQPQARLYPNPAKEHIFVEVIDFGASQYELIDMQGRVNQQGFWSSGQPILTVDLPKGMYVLRMQSSDGREIRQRFIKE